MPRRHGVQVMVTDKKEQPLIEYGSQGLGASTEFSKIISTRIEAKDGLQFYIRVTPEIPFPISAVDLAAATDRPEPKEAFFTLPPLPNDHYNLRRPRGFNEDSAVEEDEDHSAKSTPGGSRSLRLRSKTVASGRHIATAANKIPLPTELSKLRSASSNSTVRVPFDLMVSIYIDGYEKPEARQIIYLNRSHPRFSPTGYSFKGRWVRASESSASRVNTETYIEIRNWIFKSVPVSVDDLTSRMAICSTADAQLPSPSSEEDQALRELTRGLSQDILHENKEPKPGQIEVRMRRIIPGAPIHGLPFKAYHYAGHDEAVEPSENHVKEGCTHTTQHKSELGSDGKPTAVRMNTVAWKPFNTKEDLYASFIFSYMDRTKLVKLGFCDENGKPTVAEKSRSSQPLMVLTPSKLRKRPDNDDGDELRAKRMDSRIGSLPLTQGKTATRTAATHPNDDSADLIACLSRR